MRAVDCNFGADPEAGHARADDLMEEVLTKLGYAEMVSAYRAIDKWYA